MKVVFAHDHKFRKIDNKYYSTGGLSNKVLNRYTNIFDKVDVIARVIPKQDGDKRLSEISDKNINIISYSFKNKNETENFKNSVKNSDAVIARLPSFIGNKAIYYAKKYNKPYLIEVVGCPWDAMWNHSIKGKILAPYMYLKTKNLVKRCENVLYVTNKFLQKRYPSYGYSVACSDVELKEFDKLTLERRINRIYTENEEVKIGTLGAINVKYKGQEYVIKAISELNKKGYNYVYELVGGGDNTYLKSIAQKYGVLDKVRFLGTLPHEDIFSWIDNIDIYVQPSQVEGLPRALVEAMSRACPAIGSNVGGIPELLNEEVIFNKGDINSISRILENITKENLIKLSKLNYEKSKLYSNNYLINKRNQFYKQFYDKI